MPCGVMRTYCCASRRHDNRSPVFAAGCRSYSVKETVRVLSTAGGAVTRRHDQVIPQYPSSPAPARNQPSPLHVSFGK